jgi:hypothetical protein
MHGISFLLQCTLSLACHSHLSSFAFWLAFLKLKNWAKCPCLDAGLSGRRENYPVHIRGFEDCSEREHGHLLFTDQITFPVKFRSDLIYNDILLLYNNALFHHSRPITHINLSSLEFRTGSFLNPIQENYFLAKQSNSKMEDKAPCPLNWSKKKKRKKKDCTDTSCGFCFLWMHTHNRTDIGINRA